MKNFLKQISVLFIAITMLFGQTANCFADEKASTGRSFTKTISEFSDNLEAKVTLDATKFIQNTNYDIVFVLDYSEVYTETATKIISLVDALQKEIQGKEVNVKVAFTMFKGTSVGSKWFDLSEVSFSQIKNEITELALQITLLRKSGTNMPSALYHAKEMLEAEVDIPEENKFVFFVTDGIGFEFINQDLTNSYNEKFNKSFKVYEQGWVISPNSAASTEDSKVLKIGDRTTGSWTNAEWEDYFKWVEDNYEDYLKYAFNYHDKANTFTEPVPSGKNDPTPVTGVDIDIYQTNKIFSEFSEHYNAYAIPLPTTSAFYWGTYFMNYLSRNNSTDPDRIMKEIFSSIVDREIRETIEDEIENNEPHKFRIIHDINNYDFTYNGEKLVKTKIDENHIGFGELYTDEDGNEKYPVVLEFTEENDNHNDKLFWEYNYPFTNYDTIQATYKIKYVSDVENLYDIDEIQKSTAKIRTYNFYNRIIGKKDAKTSINVSNVKQPVVEDPKEDPKEDEGDIKVPEVPNTFDKTPAIAAIAFTSIAGLYFTFKFALN